MNKPRTELSVEMLLGALDAAMPSARKPKDYPLTKLVVGEERWERILQREGVAALRGFPIEFLNKDDMWALLGRKAKCNFGFSDYTAMLIPDDHYEWKRPFMLDLDHERTAEIEALLASGEITVQPTKGEYQWWYVVNICRDAGSDKLFELVTDGDSHGYRELSDGETKIHVHDWSGEISNPDTNSQIGETLADVLLARGVKVVTSGLRYESEKALEYASRCEAWASHLEKQSHE